MTSRRWICVALLGALGSPFGRADNEPFVRPWAPAVAPALAAYQAGDLQETHTLCQRILSGGADETTRFDAALLDALCLLREPTRAGRVEGRGRLAQLAQQDPTLQDEAESNLALGVALRGLSETSEALERIDVAVQAFEKAQKTPRLLAALLELARTWTAHTEWPMTPPRFGVGQPVGAAEQERVRRAQIEQLRARAAALPGSRATEEQVDLALGQMLLDRPESQAEGHALLEKLAHAPLTEVGAQAAWTLAQWHDARGEVAAALALYRRVEAEGVGKLQRDAAERVVRLTWPEVTLQVPPQAPPEAPVTIGLQARGVARVTVEVRRVDVRAWLGSQRTRGNEMSLPLTGSVLLARTFEVPNASATETWDAAQHGGDTLAVRGPVGAYIVAARATAADGRVVESRKLLFLSGLTACAAAGQERLALWATTAPAGQAPQASLWMQPSFVPTRATLEAGATTLAWPNEARLARDRRWYLLVEAGEHLALLRGELVAGVAAAPEALLLAGPAQVEVGDRLYVAGRLHGAAQGERLTLELRDVTDKLLEQKEVDVGAGGALAGTFDIAPSYLGQPLQVRARLGERVVRNLGARMTTEVIGAQRRRLQVTVDAPPWLAFDERDARVAVRVNVPWGRPPVRAPLEYTIEALALPDGMGRPIAVGRLAGEARLDGAGTAVLLVSAEPRIYGLTEGPLALRVSARVSAYAGAWRGAEAANILVAQNRPHAWLACEPTDPVPGQPVQFGLGWFDAEGIVAADSPTIAVVRGQDVVARLSMGLGSGGLRTLPWVPEGAGSYTARATMPLVGAPPLIVERAVNVGPKVAEDADAGVWCTAQWDDAQLTHATARVHGRLSAGWVALLVNANEPVAAFRGAALDGETEVVLSPGGSAAPGAQVLIVAPTAAHPCVAAARVEAPPAPLPFTLVTEGDEVWPGTTTAARIVADEAPPGTIVALTLVPALATGWLAEPDAPGVGPVDEPGLALVAAGGALGHMGMLEGGLESWSQTLRAEGQPIWLDTVVLGNEPARVAIPVPREPGLYRLLGVARTPSGATRTAAALLDARRGVRLLLDVPPTWTIGDRGEVVATLTNAGQQAASVTLKATVGAGLHVDGWRVNDAPQRDAAQMLHLEPGQTQRVYAQVEAVRVGAGQVRLEVQQPDGQPKVVERAYAIEGTETVPESTPVRVTRTLVAWRRRDAGHEAVIEPVPVAAVQEAIRRHEAGGGMVGQDDHAGHAHAADDWEPRIWQAGQPLVPGEFLELSDRIELAEPLIGVAWRQRVPFVLQRPVERVPVELPQIGELERAADDELRYRVPPRQPGVYEHRCLMAVVRPGACVLPWPELQRGAKRVDVVVEPAEQRLIVTEGR